MFDVRGWLRSTFGLTEPMLPEETKDGCRYVDAAGRELAVVFETRDRVPSTGPVPGPRTVLVARVPDGREEQVILGPDVTLNW